MELKSPRNIPLTECQFMGMVTGKFEYTDPIHNISITKQISTLDIAGTTNSIKLDGSHTDERLQKYAGMQNLIKACVDNAEAIKDRLQQIVLNQKIPLSEERRIEIMKMDFMALKQWFMHNVRSTKIYQEFSKYDSTKKLKPFSQAFNAFILDRNKYTHGQLCFLHPDFLFVLEYVETPSQRKRYAYIDTETLISYNNFYKEIVSVITEYNVIHQKRVLDSYNKTKISGQSPE